MAEELLQRLLSDPEFRAAYLATGRSPLESLSTRESRSSLAGVMLGTALEAVALLGLADGAEAAVTPLLGNHNLGFDADGIADLRAGQIDPRVMSVLDRLSHEHHLTISAMRSDHGRLTSGGSVSNHAYGRAVDIAAIDGRPVTPDNDVARRIAIELSHLDPSVRPTEIGSPWSLPGAAYFTDAEHQNHLHIGYDDPPNPSDPPPPVAEAPPNGDATADSDDPSTGDADGTGDPDDGDSSGGEDQPDGNDPSGGDADGTDNPDNDDDSSSDSSDDDDSSDEDDSDDDDDDSDEDNDDDDSSDEDDSDDDDGEDDDSDDENENEPDENEPDEVGPDRDDLEDPDRTGAGDRDQDTPDDGDGNDAQQPDGAGAGTVDPAPAVDYTGGYPGEGASKEDVAAWMAARAQARGIPGELPVMAALTESGLSNVDHGDADSVGFFQMRAGIWDTGAYAGYPDKPELQVDWFLDQAEAVMKQRIAAGLPVDDPRHFGDWIADIERPATEYRGRYQLRFDEAHGLLERAATGVRKLRLITPEEAARAAQRG